MHAITPPPAPCLDIRPVRPAVIHRRSDIIPTRTAYAAAALLVFLAEVGIAAFVHDAFVRPFLGDSLAVVLVYCAIRAATPLGLRASVAAAFAIACAIEIGQWFHVADLLGLGHFRVARIVLGTGFDPADFLAYAGGAVAVLVVEAGRDGRART